MARKILIGLQETKTERSVELIIEDGLVDEGDEALMEIALGNLMGNAWKFTEKCPQAKIEFGKTQQEDGPSCFVTDNGIGFDMDYAFKLFYPFQRLHRKDEFKGNGVGLTIAERIIYHHLGKIWAEGVQGKGATFYFTLGRS